MPKSVNKVILVGNVGKDPEVKFLPSGLPVANLTLATSERFKDKGGEWQDRTEWHNLTAYQRVAEIIRDYVKKGSKLYVEGRIQTRSWDDQASGQKKYRTEIVVNDIVLLSGRGEGEPMSAPRSGGGSYDQRPPAHQEEYAGTEITDDDIPF
jgi:single-strand DNA-binding protein